MQVTREDYVEAASEVSERMLVMFLRGRDFYAAKGKKAQTKAVCALASAHIAARDALASFGLMAATLVQKGGVKIETVEALPRNKGKRGVKKSRK